MTADFFLQAAAVANSLFSTCYKYNMQVENASVLLLLAEIHRVRYPFFVCKLQHILQSCREQASNIFFFLILPEIWQCSPWAPLCISLPIILQIIQLGSSWSLSHTYSCWVVAGSWIKPRYESLESCPTEPSHDSWSWWTWAVCSSSHCFSKVPFIWSEILRYFAVLSCSIYILIYGVFSVNILRYGSVNLSIYWSARYIHLHAIS